MIFSSSHLNQQPNDFFQMLIWQERVVGPEPAVSQQGEKNSKTVQRNVMNIGSGGGGGAEREAEMHSREP